MFDWVLLTNGTGSWIERMSGGCGLILLPLINESLPMVNRSGTHSKRWDKLEETKILDP